MKLLCLALNSVPHNISTSINSVFDKILINYLKVVTDAHLHLVKGILSGELKTQKTFHRFPILNTGIFYSMLLRNSVNLDVKPNSYTLISRN